MVNITLVEVHFQDGSFSAALPFSGLTEDETAESEADEARSGEADEDSGPGKGMALLGVLAFLAVATAVVKYLGGDDEEETPDVEIDTAPESPSAPVE